MSQQTGHAATRIRQRMDEGWFFHRGDLPIRYAVKGGMTGGLTDSPDEGAWPVTGYSEDHADCPFSEQQWRSVDLPHDWCVEGDFDRCADASHGFRPVGIGFYRKVFPLPAEARGKRIWLEFDGIMRQSTVWVNGHLMGTHPSGYTSFYYDITDVARCGEDKDNVDPGAGGCQRVRGVVVRGVRHLSPCLADDGRSPARGPLGHLCHHAVISEAAATVRMCTTICNDGSQARIAPCDPRSWTLRAPPWARWRPRVYRGWDEPGIRTGRPGGPARNCGRPTTLISTACSARCSMGIAWRTMSRRPWAIRYFEFTADRGFFLNGQPLMIKGTCNHQDLAGRGSGRARPRLNEYKHRATQGDGRQRLPLRAPSADPRAAGCLRSPGHDGHGREPQAG